MEIVEPYVFQSDSDIVNTCYASDQNFIIEHSQVVGENRCVIYFSSNDLYYPNNEIAFQEQLINKNKFEWFKTRITNASKHIFIRDIKKQWYLTGINTFVNTPEELGILLLEETKGYQVTTIGSSAGGFAAVIFGQLLQAEKIFSFNGQFEILSLLERSKKTVDPILFRYANDKKLLQYYDSRNFVKNPSSIYYFHSNGCNWDIEQKQHICDLKINIINFKTTNHGVPFLKTNLPIVLNMSTENLNSLAGKTFHPIIFSLKIAGLSKTIGGLESILRFVLNKLYIRTVLRFKTLTKTT